MSTRPEIPLNEQTQIRWAGDFQGHELSRCVWHAFLKALAVDHSLPPAIVSMPGMSGRKYRYFINALIRALPEARYLEVGSWAGSTVCAAIAGNSVKATCIDNWSEFGGPRDAFLSNVQSCKSSATTVTLIERDFRVVDWGNVHRANVYLFDGPHDERDQFDGIVLAQPALDDTFVLIVDDYNQNEIKAGTSRAIRSLQLVQHCSIEIQTTLDGKHPIYLQREHSDWHNGYFVSVLAKPPYQNPKT